LTYAQKDVINIIYVTSMAEHTDAAVHDSSKIRTLSRDTRGDEGDIGSMETKLKKVKGLVVKKMTFQE